jgi:hypothetical protein
MSAAYLSQLRQAQRLAPFGDGQGLVASTLQDGDQLAPLEQCLSTSFQCIPERVGLAATTWTIFADLNRSPLPDDTLTQPTTPPPTPSPPSPPTPSPTPAPTSGGEMRGGCAMQPGAVFDPILVGTLGFMLVSLGRRWLVTRAARGSRTTRG